MRAQEITDAVLASLKVRPCRFARLNFANGDMVGHTGDFAATVAAVETVDACLGQLEAAVLSQGGCLIVTADHGNAEDMAERDALTGLPKRDAQQHLIAKTSHSLNPVPFYIRASPVDEARLQLREGLPRGLGNIAATVLTLLGFAPPDNYLPALVTYKPIP